MKIIKYLPILMLAIFCFQSCTKTESVFTDTAPITQTGPTLPPAIETIVLQGVSNNATIGSVINFTVLSTVNNVNVTLLSQIFINGKLIQGSSFTFDSAGTYIIFAKKGNNVSNEISINVSNSSGNSFVHNTLVEEYSGTWCGNCPRLLYGVDLLKQQNVKAIFVGIHLFGNDPFITSQGNSFASSQGVGGVPTGRINRTVNWNGPQYQNTNQVVNEIKQSSTVGIAINSSLNNRALNIDVNVGYTEQLTGGAKLTVYLVEDNLFFTQRNYSSNIYGGQASIPNFKYNGVLRAIISNASGDEVAISGKENIKNYTPNLPTNISNPDNVKIVAFITSNLTGKVINAQEIKLGVKKDFDYL